MNRSQRLNSHYSRVLGIAIGISLVVHAAILAFGQFAVNSTDPVKPALSVVTLADVEIAPEEWERLDEATKVTSAALITQQLLSAVQPEELPSPDYDPAKESALVLATATTAQLSAPLVPQPRLEPAAVESNLTPIHVLEPIAFGTKDEGRSSGGGFIISFGGAGCAAPAFVNQRFPSQPVGISQIQIRGTR